MQEDHHAIKTGRYRRMAIERTRGTTSSCGPAALCGIKKALAV